MLQFLDSGTTKRGNREDQTKESNLNESFSFALSWNVKFLSLQRTRRKRSKKKKKLQKRTNGPKTEVRSGRLMVRALDAEKPMTKLQNQDELGFPRSRPRILKHWRFKKKKRYLHDRKERSDPPESNIWIRFSSYGCPDVTGQITTRNSDCRAQIMLR